VAFQINAFQRNAFQFFTGGSEPPHTTGGLADYRAYRKRLKKIASIAERRLYKKAETKLEALAAAAPLEIQKEAKAISAAINFQEIAQTESQEMHAALLRAIKNLDVLIEEAILREENEEEELILMAALS